MFIPDYREFNQSYISYEDKALEIPADCIVLPPGVFQCPQCNRLFSGYGSSGAISKFPYAPTGLTTLGGYVWWKIVHCCGQKYLIRVTGRD